MQEKQTSPVVEDWSTLTAWVSLSILVVAAIALRVPGLFWLLGVGPTDDYSFNTDDQRFVDLAKNFNAGMPDGYVHGMTTHLLALRAVIEPLFPGPNLLQLLKVVTLTYAGLSVILTYALARDWSVSNKGAVLAAFFVTTAPMHVACSNFGTADVTAVFCFYLTMFAQGRYIRTSEQLWFVISAALTGVAIAVKLFVPLLLPLLLLILLHRGRAILTQGLTAALVAIGAFETALLFSYSPTDFVKLWTVLRDDNLSITAGNGPFKQAVLYAWDFISAVNLPVVALIFAGFFVCVLPSVRSSAVRIWHRVMMRGWRSFLTPGFLLFVTLFAHAVLLALADIHGARHLLVFVPIACIGAAYSLIIILGRIRHARVFSPVIVALLCAYCVYNAVAVESLFVHDVRNDASRWAGELRAQGKEVLTFSNWSQLKHVSYEPDIAMSALAPDSHVLTCDMEFNRYLRGRYAEDLYAAYGGQERLNFFWDAFQGRSQFAVLRDFRQFPLSLEQKLIDRQILRPIGTFVPKRCLILGPATLGARVPTSDLWPRLYYTSGW